METGESAGIEILKVHRRASTNNSSEFHFNYQQILNTSQNRAIKWRTSSPTRK